MQFNYYCSVSRDLGWCACVSLLWAIASFPLLRVRESLIIFSLPPSRGRITHRSWITYSRLFSPLPTAVRALHFYREISALIRLSSLGDSRRIGPTHARRSQQFSCVTVDPFLFLQIVSKSVGGIRTPGPTLISLLVSSFEGDHYRPDHRGDRLAWSTTIQTKTPK